MSGVFQKLYGQLNERQKEAVDALEGPVMVAAGPGTGKTQVLTLRIANLLLKNKAKAEEVLALTFTENAAFNMKRRLFEILGPAAYRVRISTFHAFCNDIILEHPESFSFVKSARTVYEGARSIPEVEQVKIIEKILQSGNFERININNPFVNYISELSRAISSFKREGILPADYKRIIDKEAARVSSADDLYHEKGAHRGKVKAKYRDRLEQIAKNREICEIYQKYQEALEAAGLYDYDDMILFVLSALRSFDLLFLTKLQEQFRYILVDEHQDANSAQNEVVELLARTHKNIFVVGDEKQSIFRFQGASLENILYFKNKFSESRIISLEKNYRSAQKIIDCAQSVIANNSQQLNNYLNNFCGELVCAHSDFSGEVQVLEAENSDDEHCFIARKVKELNESGVSFGKIAVLYRNNWEGQEIAAVLAGAGIPYHVESDRNIFDDKLIKDFIYLLKFAARDDLSPSAFLRKEIDEEVVKLLFSGFAGIPALDIYKLSELRAFGSKRRGVLSFMTDRALLEQSGIESAEKIYAFANMLSNCLAAARQKNAPCAFEVIAKESGFLQYLVSLNSQDAIAKFNTLFKELKSVSQGKFDYTLKDFVLHLELLQKYRISLSQKSLRIPVDAVRLMTAHKAKGLEFDYIVISGCSDSRWGGRKRPDPLKILQITERDRATLYGREIEEERRLFYVALTRARYGVFATCALQNFEGREQIPSRFLGEIRPELKSSVDVSQYVLHNIFETLREPEYRQKISADSLRIEDAEYLRALFLKRGFAATHLNDYITCPWKYFFRDLIRLPEAQVPHLIYGNAMHLALKNFFDNISGSGRDNYRGQTPIVLKKYLLTEFISVLEGQPLREHEFLKYRERGEKALGAYYDYYNNLGSLDAGVKTINEFDAGSVMLDGEVRLMGKIDKIELRKLSGSDPDSFAANVVDYKTGRRKTRGELLGHTKSSKGNEYRQLVFYKLLLDKLNDNIKGQAPLNFVMTSGEIDFVEPDKRATKFYKEKFVISDEDVCALEYKIQDVTSEILSLSFWDKRCEDKNCRYCKLRGEIK